jgi:glucosyl-3-phosphoglycerate synthase
MDLRAQPRRFDHRRYSVRDLLAREESVCVMLPARNEAATIGAIVDVLVALKEARAIDEVIVIDAASPDGTSQIASDHGATVLQRAALLPGFGPALGKGDAVWRGLSSTGTDIVCLLDADLVDVDDRFVIGLVAPLLAEPSIQLVKGAFERPYCDSAGTVSAGEGGRVTELMARPLLRLWYPELAGFDQPLSGQWAARRDFLLQLPFWTAYALEICLLLEAYKLGGMASLAQSDLGVLRNRHQALQELSCMSDQVLVGVMQHMCSCGDAASVAPFASAQHARVVRRPPLNDLVASPMATPAPSTPALGPE